MGWGEVISSYEGMVRMSWGTIQDEATLCLTQDRCSITVSPGPFFLPVARLQPNGSVPHHLSWPFPSPCLCLWCSPLLLVYLKSTRLASPDQNFPVPGRLPRLSQLGWWLLLRNPISVHCQPPLSGTYHTLPLSIAYLFLCTSLIYLIKIMESAPVTDLGAE